MWASNDHIRVRLGREGPQGSGRGQDGAAGWGLHVLLHHSSPYIPEESGRLALPAPGGFLGFPQRRVGSMGRDSSGRHQVAACVQMRTSGHREGRALGGACVTLTHPPSTRTRRSVPVFQLRDGFVEVTVHVHGAE